MAKPRLRFIRNVSLKLKDGSTKICVSGKNYPIDKLVVYQGSAPTDKTTDIYFSDGSIALAVEQLETVCEVHGGTIEYVKLTPPAPKPKPKVTPPLPTTPPPKETTNGPTEVPGTT